MGMTISPLQKDPELLCPCVKHKHRLLVNACRDRGVYLVTVETLRALDRQRYYIRIGVSWTMNSKHLPQPPHQRSLAFDVVPNGYLSHPLWNPEGEEWDVLIEEAERLGLKSGFTMWGKDKPHFHQEECGCDLLIREQVKEVA